MLTVPHALSWNWFTLELAEDSILPCQILNSYFQPQAIQKFHPKWCRSLSEYTNIPIFSFSWLIARLSCNVSTDQFRMAYHGVLHFRDKAGLITHLSFLLAFPGQCWLAHQCSHQGRPSPHCNKYKIPSQWHNILCTSPSPTNLYFCMLTFYSCQMIQNDSWLQKPCTNRDVQLKDMLQKQSLEMCGSEVNCYFSYTLSPQVFISNLRTEVAVD